MMFRANHIYLLLSAFLNLLMGLLIFPQAGTASWFFRVAGSVLLIVATPMFLAAFFTEAAPGDFERPLSFLAVVTTVVGMGSLFLSVVVVRLAQR